MVTPLCALCDTPITPENNSREHIIPNALGGRRTVNAFICDPCNNTSGHSWDAALARQLNPLCLFFQISRQRGAPPAQEFPISTGGSIRVTPNGLELPKPTVDISSTETGAKINVVARNMPEARKILTGLKGKYPAIDVEAVLQSVTSQYSYLAAPIGMNLSVGGPDGGRAIVKSAFALAVANGVSPSDCADARRYLATGTDACFGYYHETDLLTGRPEKTVVHCVAVASTDDGLLLGYVELFSTFRMVVCLGSNYRGAPVNAVYAIAPVTGAELDVKVRLQFSREDLDDIYAYRRIPDGAIAAAMDEIIPEAMKRSMEKEQAAAIHRAISDAWRKLDLEPNTLLTDEHQRKLSTWIAEGLTPFILHNLRQRGHGANNLVPPFPVGLDKG